MFPLLFSLLKTVLKTGLKFLTKKQSKAIIGKEFKKEAFNKTAFYVKQGLVKQLGVGKELSYLKTTQALINKEYGSIPIRGNANDLLKRLEVKKLQQRIDNDKRQELRKLARMVNNAKYDYEQYMVKVFRERQGLSKNDFVEFRDFMFNRMNEKERKDFGDIFKDEINVIFKSSWIFFGLFITYGKNKDRGILALQLKNGSKRNPSGFYQWVNIPKEVWLKICKDPTGTNFWAKWYRVNRTNKRYLTAESIYWYNLNENGKKIYPNR